MTLTYSLYLVCRHGGGTIISQWSIQTFPVLAHGTEVTELVPKLVYNGANLCSLHILANGDGLTSTKHLVLQL